MPIHSKHLVLSQKNRLAAIYNLKSLKELHISPKIYQIGNIYIGIVDGFLKNIEAAFIRLSNYEKNGFLQSTFYTNSREELVEKTQSEKKILVQIIKEPTSTKGPRLSTNVGLIGTYIILLPFESSIKIEKNITDLKEKLYLKSILTVLKPIKVGVLIKKEAIKVNSNNLKHDFSLLQKNGVE